MSSDDTLAILSARIFVSSLYIRFTQEMGLQFDNSVAMGFLGIRVINMWLEDLRSGLPLKNCLTRVNTVCFNSGHRALKNPTVNRVDLISSSMSYWVSHMFMSGDTTLGNFTEGYVWKWEGFVYFLKVCITFVF